VPNNGLCSYCSIKISLFHEYYNANIPVNYWNLKMPINLALEKLDNKSQRILAIETIRKISKLPNYEPIESLLNHKLMEIDKIYVESIGNVKNSYNNGLSYCLAGPHGTGKTLSVTSILKSIIQQKFTGLYTTLSDVVNVLTTATSEDKFLARKELLEIDFLIIDEFDSRFIGTENAADLFGRTLENILRTRLQNKLPIILVSNSPNPIETFHGPLKQSLESLMNQVPLKVVIGQDYRKQLV